MLINQREYRRERDRMRERKGKRKNMETKIKFSKLLMING